MPRLAALVPVMVAGEIPTRPRQGQLAGAGASEQSAPCPRRRIDDGNLAGLPRSVQFCLLSTWHFVDLRLCSQRALRSLAVSCPAFVALLARQFFFAPT